MSTSKKRTKTKERIKRLRVIPNNPSPTLSSLLADLPLTQGPPRSSPTATFAAAAAESSPRGESLTQLAPKRSHSGVKRTASERECSSESPSCYSHSSSFSSGTFLRRSSSFDAAGERKYTPTGTSKAERVETPPLTQPDPPYDTVPSSDVEEDDEDESDTTKEEEEGDEKKTKTVVERRVTYFLPFCTYDEEHSNQLLLFTLPASSEAQQRMTSKQLTIHGLLVQLMQAYAAPSESGTRTLAEALLETLFSCAHQVSLHSLFVIQPTEIILDGSLKSIAKTAYYYLASLCKAYGDSDIVHHGIMQFISKESVVRADYCILFEA